MGKTKKIAKLIFFILFSFQLLLFSDGYVYALSLDEQAGFGSDGNEIGSAFGVTNSGSKDIRAIVAEYIKVFLGFLGLIFLGLLLVAGFNWMTAMGNSEKTNEALSLIKSAVIGLMIILASYALTEFVLKVIQESIKKK